MKTISTLAAIVLFTGAVMAAPAVEVDTTEFNFGKTIQNATLTHDFWVYSTGDEPLVIGKIVPGCGCTKSWVEDTTIAPGDSTRLHIVFETGRFRGFVSKRPHFFTNASEDPVHLKIHAELLPNPETMTPVIITPNLVDVSQFDERPRRRAKFTLTNTTEQDLNITVLDNFNKSFSAKVPDAVPAGGQADVIITVDEDKVETEFAESITLQLDDFDGTIITVPIKRNYYAKK